MIEPDKNFQDFTIWQKAHSLVLAVYKISSEMPGHEQHGLIAQIRKSVIEVPSNIAKAYKLAGKNQKLEYFNLAEASLAQTRYLLILADDLGYAKTSKLLIKTEEINEMLSEHISRLNQL